MDDTKTKQAFRRAAVKFRRLAKELANAERELTQAEAAYFADDQPPTRSTRLVGRAGNLQREAVPA